MSVEAEKTCDTMENPKQRSERPDDRTCDWEESDRCCDECGKLCWEAPWWDDSRANGGSCIGTRYECGECDWIDSN